LQEYGADAADLSALWFDADSPCEGDDVLFPLGYSQIVQAVARGLHDVIRLQHKVTRICYSNSSSSSLCSGSTCSCQHNRVQGGNSSAPIPPASGNRSSIKSSCTASTASLDQQNGCCCSSSGITVQADTPRGSITLHARHAIVTFPIGVLKAHSSSLFEPPLPAEKQAAIAKLGVGLLNKVSLNFNVQGTQCYFGTALCSLLQLCMPASPLVPSTTNS
jgi:hypothetical protein